MPARAHDGAAINENGHEALELRRMSTSTRDPEQEEDVEDMLYHSKPSRDEREEELNRRTLLKLDWILLPFLALLFLFNSLDRSNASHYGTSLTTCSKANSQPLDW